MNDIKTLEIENFQSHIKTQIALAPAGQLTVITGPTDSGKTAIFRALRWLLYNTPQGSDFIRAGCSFCRVTATMKSGHIVVREVTPSKNQYRIIAPGAEKPIVLEGFGRSVPVEVQEITGVRSVAIGDTKYNLNMAEQLDGPFLGSSISAPDRAKVLGKLAGTEVLDHAGKQAGTDIYRQTQKKDSLEADIKQLTESIATYAYLPALAGKIAALDAAVTDIKAKQIRLINLADRLRRLNQIDINICCCNVTLDRWKAVDAAADVVVGIVAGVEKAAKLQRHSGKLSALQSGITGAQETIKRLDPLGIAETIISSAESQLKSAAQAIAIRDRKNILEGAIRNCQDTIAKFAGIGQAESLTGDICTKAERLRKLQSAKVSINHLGDTVEGFKKHVSSYTQRVDSLQYTYQEVLSELNICPFCGTVLSSKTS